MANIWILSIAVEDNIDCYEALINNYMNIWEFASSALDTGPDPE